jgi:Mce-associated membrane protein
MNPTLYDILGVSPDASREEIRKAWRESADRFEPGEGGSTKQFRLFNEAAEVLLDPQRRKEYDEQLGLTASGQVGEPAASVPSAPVPGTARAATQPAAAAADKTPAADKTAAGEKDPEAGDQAAAADKTTDKDSAAKPGPVKPDKAGSPKKDEVAGEKPAVKPTTAGVAAVGGVAGAAGDAGNDGAQAQQATASSSDGGRTLGWPVLAVLGVLTAVAVGVASYLVISAQRAEAYQESLDRAPASAESAATAVLSYDWESLEADRDAAAKFLTEDYREDYLNTFDKLITDNATQTKATVEAEVLASSAMLGTPADCEDGEGGSCSSSGERDPDRVPVLLFVNQTATNTTSSEPSVALNRVRFDMVNVDGTWLVDGITSY